MLARLKDFPAAMKAIDKAISIDAGVSDYHKLRGIFLSNLARPQEAMQALEKAQALDPADQALPGMIEQLKKAVAQ